LQTAKAAAQPKREARESLPTAMTQFVLLPLLDGRGSHFNVDRNLESQSNIY